MYVQVSDTAIHAASAFRIAIFKDDVMTSEFSL